MVATLSLGADSVPFETTSSNVASVHNLILEAGDYYTCKYNIRSINEFGESVPYDISGYTVVAQAHSEDFLVEKVFTIAVTEEVAASGIFNIITLTISAVDTADMAVNPRYTWGIRFTDKVVTTKTFTFLAGTITFEERSLV